MCEHEVSILDLPDKLFPWINPVSKQLELEVSGLCHLLENLTSFFFIMNFLRSIPRYCGPEEIHDRASFDCSYLGNEMAGSVQKSIDT